MSKVGRMRDRITFRDIGRTEDALGGFSRSDSDGDEVWADIVPVSAREAAVYAQRQIRVTHKIIMRYRTVVHGQILRSHTGTDYYVESFTNPDGVRRFVEVFVREGGPD